MNQAYSDAVKAWSEERTKQAKEESIQAKERTQRTKWETVKMALAALGTGGSLYVMAKYPGMSLQALFVGMALTAPQAISSTVNGFRELIAEKKKVSSVFPEPSRTEQLPASSPSIIRTIKK